MTMTPEEKFNKEFGGEDWENMDDFDNETFTFTEPGQVFQGRYVSAKFDVGKHNSALYRFNVDGQSVAIWGSYQLDQVMEDVNRGDQVAILYKGKEVNPKTGRSFKAYKIRNKRGTIAKAPVKDDDSPF